MLRWSGRGRGVLVGMAASSLGVSDGAHHAFMSGWFAPTVGSLTSPDSRASPSVSPAFPRAPMHTDPPVDASESLQVSPASSAVSYSHSVPW